ncbi:MAG: GTP-binding protein [Gemmatimonadaceae bacterium]
MTSTIVTQESAVLSRSRMNIVIGGHVDHGKSTVVGRLMADTNSLPQGKLEQVRAHCERNARPFEYAFLLDALKDEQAQGITIDSARVFFKTPLRDYILIDAPGHIEFLRNLITGAARAEAALLVVDAAEGLQENSRRHGYMMSLLGIRRIALLINKMDLVDYDQQAFHAIADEFRAFLASLGVELEAVLPVCARDGVNIARRAVEMPWYHGPTVLELLDTFPQEPAATDLPFRMPVQDVYKFTAGGDDRRIIAGTVDCGSVTPGMELVFYPSGKRSRIKTIEAFNRAAPTSAGAGEATGFTLTEQVYVARGEVAVRADQPAPKVSTRLRASIFWLGRAPMVPGREYGLRLGTARTTAHLEAVHRVIDASNLSAQENKTAVERHDVAECTLRLARPVAFDRTEDSAATSRFVLVDGYEISGGGIVREAMPDAHAVVQERVLIRDAKWESGQITRERRANRYGQQAALVLVTGADEASRKETAKNLEMMLFDEGRAVYYSGIGNVVYGVDADLGRAKEDRQEHVRRLAEVANLMLDAGLILVATAAELGEDEASLVRATITGASCSVVWVGDEVTTDLRPDLHLTLAEAKAYGIHDMKRVLQEAGVLLKARQ